MKLRRWTPEEDARLIASIGKYTSQETAYMMGRSDYAVDCRLWLLRGGKSKDICKQNKSAVVNELAPKSERGPYVNSGPKPDPEIDELAERLGAPRKQAAKMGRRRLYRMLGIDPPAKRYVKETQPMRIPPRAAARIERMVLLAGKKRWAA